MRIEKSKENLDYKNLEIFFNNRAKKFKEDNPYSVTMYQDDKPELVKMRNQKETNILLPKLEIQSSSKILDISCGIGRWVDAIDTNFSMYLGIDFCEDFIKIAKKRNLTKHNVFFENYNTVDIKKCIDYKSNKFNRVLIIGALMYLNDIDLENVLLDLNECLEENALIIIREPIALNNRLTLKNEYSNELVDNYNAIYRSKDELIKIFNETLCKNGFKIIENDFLFKDTELNNRKETSQYYFVLERQIKD